ncbi:MAG: hypothetical protein CL609_16355 [Anaerolineaceae bacterium]|nr:hypothetical protein [Anaerolineaceae bacterium]
MEKITFSSIQSIKIEKVKGNLYIRTWENAEVQIIYNPAKRFDANDNDGLLTLEAEDSILISAPKSIKSIVEEVRGNCSVYGEFDHFIIEKVGGNLEISHAQDINVEVVGGNCILGVINGNVNVEKVGGNLHAFSVLGDGLFEKIGGNLYIKGTLSNISCDVGGNATIICDSLAYSENKVRAGGNIKMSMQPETDFDLTAAAGAQLNIKVGQVEEKVLTRTIKKTFGAGGPKLSLKAGGNLKLTDRESLTEKEYQPKPFDDEAWSALEERVENNLGSNAMFDLSYFMNLEKEINEEVNQKTKFAQERIQAAMAKMNKKFQGFNFDSGFEGTVAKKQNKTEGVSEEERMMILKMLQDKKITAEEADHLLQILDEV